MKFFRIFFLFLLFLPVFLTGTVRAEGSGASLITGVQVTCHRESTTVTREYVQPHKISAVLNYLRLLKCGGKADADPQQLAGDSFEILIYDAGGQQSVYRQRANRFFSKNNKPWVRISPAQASALYPLILSMPPDK